MTVLGALRRVIEQEGVFCALYSHRASHFFWMPRAGGKIHPERPTQVGRALRELGIGMIPAYSPQARGRSARSFGTDILLFCQRLAIRSSRLRFERASVYHRRHPIELSIRASCQPSGETNHVI
jgi:hypothetical protein